MKTLRNSWDYWTDRWAFQKMLTINHLHSMIRQMEHEIRKQKAKAAMLFNDILTMKKSRWLRMHFQKNHSGCAWQVSPEPLPILPPFQSPSPPPPPIPIPGTPENPIDVDTVKASGTSLYSKDQVWERSDCQVRISSRRPVIDSLGRLLTVKVKLKNYR